MRYTLWKKPPANSVANITNWGKEQPAHSLIENLPA